jgi:hypothetical protein
LREGQWNHQHRQQGHILEITHFVPPCSDLLFQSESIYIFEPGCGEKLQQTEWLNSAIVAEINHLGASGMRFNRSSGYNSLALGASP